LLAVRACEAFIPQPAPAAVQEAQREVLCTLLQDQALRLTVEETDDEF
jgi:hypothetical protein